MLKEFKEFALKGNLVDMAVGIIIGGAFSKIISSLVNDLVMPPIGKLIGNVDFANLYINLGDGEYDSLASAQEAGAATINYGLFINNAIDFIILAFVIFMVIRMMNRLKREAEAPPAEPTTKSCPLCFTEIPVKASRCPHCTSDLKAA